MQTGLAIPVGRNSEMNFTTRLCKEPGQTLLPLQLRFSSLTESTQTLPRLCAEALPTRKLSDITQDFCDKSQRRGFVVWGLWDHNY